MKKIFFILISLVIFTALCSNEIFVQEGGKFYKVELSENGDTLSKEEINIVPLDTQKAEEQIYQLKDVPIEDNSKILDEPVESVKPLKTAEQNLYNPQLLRIVPFKWQAGWYGAWQGFFYGTEFALGLGIMEKKYSPLVVLSTPALMFFLPPILIKDDVPDYSLAFIDWGYRIGPFDYLSIRSAASKSEFGKTYSVGSLDVMPDALTAMAFGYAESWGGYTLARKLGPFRRAASDMYAAGAYMGYVWGGLTGLYLSEKIVTDEYPEYDNTWYTDSAKWVEDSTEMAAYNSEISRINQEKELYGFSTALLFSLGFRSAGFYFGNKEEHKLKSFDGYFYTFNSITGFLLANEIDNYTNFEDEMLLMHTAMSMITTGATAYLMKDIHLDDGNAILMMIGGVVGGTLGQGIELVIESYTNENFVSAPKFHTSVGAICMVAGEFGVYMLRKDAIQSGSDFGNNLGFNIYPTKNNGLGANLSYSF
ncbi:MAG: hypothetical protein AB7T10_04155 [bacterium]